MFFNTANQKRDRKRRCGCLTQPEEHRKAVIEYWWEKADAGILSAKREFDAGAYSFAKDAGYNFHLSPMSIMELKKDRGNVPLSKCL